ncbi:MAG: hypothetical protein CMP65_06205 [Flavobacteriales bacterium]|nr:hypothetical protein [Flavobacteriales bacterium]
MRLIFIISIIFSFNACNQKKNTQIRSKTFIDEKLKNIEINSRPKVFFSLDPECPLCKSYSKKINEIRKEFQNHYDFYTFFPSKVYSKDKTLDFISINKIDMKIIIDTNQVLTKFLNAKITPECFVVDSNFNLIYKGLIDDWIKELGRKGQFVQNEYLINSLKLYLNNKKIQIKETQAIGCIIQK